MQINRLFCAWSLVAVTLLSAISGGQAATILVEPPGASTSSGFPAINLNMRWQQVYDSSFFGSGPIQINSFGFRGVSSNNGPIDYSDWTVTMSTSVNGAGSLSTTFANNVGADVTTVMGSQSISFGSVNGDFTTFVLDTAFNYNPTLGDLLLEITHSPSTDGATVLFTAYGPDPNPRPAGLQRIVNSGLPNAIGNNFEFGELVTQFNTTVVPLPAALPLFGAGLAGLGLLGWRRKRKAAQSL